MSAPNSGPAAPGPYHWGVRWMRWASLVIACIVSLLAPSGALARVIAPPGHSGTSQYVEVIPSSGGNAAPPGSVKGSGSANVGPKALSGFGQGRSTDARLVKLGTAGQAAATLAAATAPTPLSGATKAAGSAAAKKSAGSQGDSPASGISAALTSSDSGGLGILLPLLLATALIAAVGVIAGRLARRPRAS
jgi:hypothetical protein